MQWYVPDQMIEVMHFIDQTFVLGNGSNVVELEELLKVIRDTTFDCHQRAQRLQCTLEHASTASRVDCTNFVLLSG